MEHPIEYTYSGSIHMLIGPMFAGKSSALIREINIARVIGKNCLVVKHIVDVRTLLKVSSHDKLSLDAVSVSNLNELYEGNLLNETDVIGIDEGQFFPDLVEFCEEMANRGKKIYVSGLSGDFGRNEFTGGQITKLLSKAETCTYFRAMCNYCKENEASFSVRKDKNEKSGIKVGGSDDYSAACRKCYYENK